MVAFLSLSSAMRSRCRISDRESGRVNIPPEEEVEVVAAAAEVAATAASTGRMMREIGIIGVDAMNNTAEKRSCNNDDGIAMRIFETGGVILDVDIVVVASDPI